IAGLLRFERRIPAVHRPDGARRHQSRAADLRCCSARGRRILVQSALSPRTQSDEGGPVSVTDNKLFDLTSKVALVTGTSRGLGRSGGRPLVGAGADLGITSRKLADLEAFRAEVESLGRQAFPVELDVRSYDSIQSAVGAAVAHYGKIDILVNNAGLNVRTPAGAITRDYPTPPPATTPPRAFSLAPPTAIY